MSIKAWIIDQLKNNGMCDQGAEAVFALIESDDRNFALRGRWNDSIEDYPKGMLTLVWRASKRIALKWIDENCPEAWFRPMFAE